MPKFVIERQYLVPMYQHIVVEADILEVACEKAVSDDMLVHRNEILALDDIFGHWNFF